MNKVILKPKRDKSVRQKHPWVFSGAVQRVEGEPADGDVVEVYTAGGEWLARGSLNRQSQIAVRLLTWDEDETIEADFWRRRLERAIAGRRVLQDDPVTSAYRLVNAEADGLPGLIVDRYGDYLLTQFLTMGVERWRAPLTALLGELLSPLGIYDRSDVDVREKEGLPQTACGLAGEEPPDEIEILENGFRFLVDVKCGHKTGFYLDQRDNRRRAAPYFEEREVLNCFAYTGAFAVYAAGSGAAWVVNLDSSAAALALAQRNVGLNQAARPDDEYIAGDVFAELRRFRDQGRSFDAVVLDPPKFVHSKPQLQRATRAYKDINWLACRLLRPGGVLVTFSCSGLVKPDLFQKIVFGAALDAGREVQVLEKLGQGVDHPILLTYPESEYLKGLVCRVL
ncbi:MAG: class I SAM-dependent methyltransferase [Thermoflexales bacterium]|nr:class I SAM-dependent methyltransferase [Thermoflexales bacterium]